MNKNIFYKKFQEKTDSELKQILIDKHKYTEQAINASLQILEERNGQTPDLEIIQKKIEQTQQKNEIAKQNVTEEVKKKSHLTDDPNAPELHSKKVIMVFSGLFSTIFGAVLLMYNMKQTDNRTGRIQVLVFGVLYTIATLLVVNLMNIGGNIALIFNIAGGGILTEYFWNKFIGKDFEHRKRSWIKPAIISVLITIPLILAAIYGQ